MDNVYCCLGRTDDQSIHNFKSRKLTFYIVYTDAVSFVTASVSISLHGAGRVRYQHRVVLKTLSKVERFQNDTVSLIV